MYGIEARYEFEKIRSDTVELYLPHGIGQ